MSSTYTVDLAFYKEMKYDLNMESQSVLMAMAKEMIYYHHWSNLIMFQFLHTPQDIEAIIGSLEIKTMGEYFASGSVF
jgi:hypothetical protein